MKIIHRYVLAQISRNFALALGGFTFLFLVFDFFDRIDNILPENASLVLILEYFLFKIPLMVSLMLPVAVLVATLLTLGILSKNSEITAMRAAGLRVLWILKPVFIFGVFLSFFAILWNETLVPYSYRRVKEIYNIDIRRKDKTGSYSQTNFWWRSDKEFFSVDIFDSRTNTLDNLSRFEIDDNFRIVKRTDALKTSWVNPELSWNMQQVTQYKFPLRPFDTNKPLGQQELTADVRKFTSLPLVIRDTPADFYETHADPSTMSYRQLSNFIKRQQANGIEVGGYLADLYEKLATPFMAVVAVLVAFPFALKTGRSGSLALSFLAGFTIAFFYYAIHSFSLAMGEAQLWPALLSAWMANIIMGLVGMVLCLGAESPG